MRVFFKNFIIIITIGTLFSGCFYHGVKKNRENKNYLIFKRFMSKEYLDTAILFEFQMHETSNENLDVFILWKSYSSRKISLKLLNPLLIIDQRKIPMSDCKSFKNGVGCKISKLNLPNSDISRLQIKVDIETPSLIKNMSTEQYSLDVRNFCKGYNPSNFNACYQKFMNKFIKEKSNLNITPMIRYYENEGHIDTFNEFIKLLRNTK